MVTCPVLLHTCSCNRIVRQPFNPQCHVPWEILIQRPLSWDVSEAQGSDRFEAGADGGSEVCPPVSAGRWVETLRGVLEKENWPSKWPLSGSCLLNIFHISIVAVPNISRGVTLCDT